MQRYCQCSLYSYPSLKPAEDGEWVKYSDASAQLSEAQRRVEELESLLRKCSTNHSVTCRINFPSEGTASMSADGKFESHITNPGGVCTCGADQARAALRVGTQHE